MKIKTVQLSVLHQNSYLFYDETTKAGVIIDPGSHSRMLIQEIVQENISLKGILLTHGHFDHIGAVMDIKERYKVPIVACHKELEILDNPDINYSSTYMTRPISIKPDMALKDNDEFEFSGKKIKCIYTPGHTIGGFCYYYEEEGILFSGDTLFFESIGRTDLETANQEELLRSIKEKLFVLPDTVVVYPGHMQPTTIGHEKTNNPNVV